MDCNQQMNLYTCSNEEISSTPMLKLYNHKSRRQPLLFTDYRGDEEVAAWIKENYKQDAPSDL